MTWLNAPGIRRTIALCCALLIAANAVFLLVRLGDSVVPKWRIALNLQEAFKQGSATTNVRSHLMAGIDQYTDCVTFQLILLGNSGALRNALAPRLLSVEGIVDGVV